MKIYEVRSYSSAIHEIEADRVGENSVWINGRRHSRNTSWVVYFDSQDEAVQYTRARLQRVIDNLNDKLAELPNKIQKAEEKLAEFNARHNVR